MGREKDLEVLKVFYMYRKAIYDHDQLGPKGDQFNVVVQDVSYPYENLFKKFVVPLTCGHHFDGIKLINHL